MGKILKKGWFVVLVIIVTFAMIGFYVGWTFFERPYRVIKFKYTQEFNIKLSDFKNKDNVQKVKDLKYSMYTGNAITTYTYVNADTLKVDKVDDYYVIKINQNAFNSSKINKPEDTAKGFLRNLTLVVVENYVNLDEYPDTYKEKKDKDGKTVVDDNGEPIILTIKGVSTLFDTAFYNKNSLNEEGNLLTEGSYSTFYKNVLITTLAMSIGGLIVGLVTILVLGHVFVDKLEREEEIFDNETVFKTPFHKAYWSNASKELKSVRKMAVASILLGLTLISKLITLPSGFGTLGFGFGIIFLSVACMISGPYSALAIGAISDVIGFFIDSKGGWFNPMFTLSAMLACFTYAIFFYRSNISFTKCLIARIIISFVCNFLLEGFGQMITMNYEFDWLLFTSLPKQVAYLIPQSILLYVVLITIAPIAADTNFIDEKIKKGISLF